MPESVTDRPTKSHEYIFLLSKRERYYYDAEAIKEPSVTNDPRRPYTSQGAWEMDGRPVEQRHGGKVRSPAGWKTGNGSHGSIHENGREQEVTYVEDTFTKRNIRSVWTVATQPYSDAHFATFPEALIKPCILRSAVWCLTPLPVAAPRSR
jgi:site-specific DNA-methyltransferase (cytosine-N4-specific)